MKKIINFTVKSLDSLELPSKGQEYVFDEQVKGLSLRTTHLGVKAFVVRKRMKGQANATYVHLGYYPDMTISQARIEARESINLLSQGINPNNLKGDVITKQSITLQKVFDDYTTSKHNLKEDTVKDYLSILKNYLGDWKKKPIAEISRDMVEQRHREITYGTGKFAQKDGSPSRANKTMRVVRALFNYAIGQYEDIKGEPLFVHNPIARITHNKTWNKENIRQTVVHKHDLKKWYEGVMKLPHHYENTKSNNSAEVVRDFLIFEMFTGLRRHEALTLKWEDIDFDNHSFTIEDTKNKESHSLPLNFKLDEVLERRMKDRDDNPYIFKGSKPNGHLHPPKRQLHRARELIGFEFTNHDLRRAFETTANRLAFSKYTLDKLINHKNSQDITGRYIVLDIEELREPMKMIAEELWSQMK
tara:strand:+ start:129 stop:1379 length:1251 start_codon:yes stop_codon:yes gene_type:complete